MFFYVRYNVYFVRPTANARYATKILQALY